MPFVLRTIRPEPGSGFEWKAPLLGGSIYVALAGVLAIIGKRWHPVAHMGIGAGWLLIGAFIFTVMTMK